MTARSDLPYRPDIDGLRALAVTSVLAFHLEFEYFRGGFVGVDVFFVISGFLITRLILKEFNDGTFSFANFYVRRARRLFPALFAVVLFSFVAGFLLFSPTHFQKLAESVIFTIFAGSNFLFWKEAGYFDIEASYKPLLHTWSLAVEEQFYLVWPATLVALLWLRRTWIVFLFLAIAGTTSLLSSELFMRTDPAAAFYLAPFRAVEFLLGAIMVWLLPHQPRHKMLLEPLVLFGLLLIAYPVFTYSERTSFPGFAALIPCTGAAILIYSGTAKFTGHLLKNRLAVGLGLISYSLYLVHWPLIVFYKYWNFGSLTLTSQIGIAACSIIIATGMYFFVEQRFRRPHADVAYRPSYVTFVGSCAGLSFLLMLPAAHAFGYGGWDWRLSKSAQRSNELARPFKLRSACERFNNPGTHQICFFGKERGNQVDLLSFGDSHAEMLVAGLGGFLKDREKSGLLITAGGTLPFYSTVTFRGERPANFQFNLAMKQYAALRPKVVLIHARFALHWSTSQRIETPGKDIASSPGRFVTTPNHKLLTKLSSQMAFLEGLNDTLTFFSDHGLNVLVVGTIPELGIDPKACLTRPSYLLGDTSLQQCARISFRQAFARANEVNEIISTETKRYKNAIFFDPAPIICRDEATGFCDMFADGNLLYRDAHHLSAYGAKHLVSHIDKTLTAMMAR